MIETTLISSEEYRDLLCHRIKSRVACSALNVARIFVEDTIRDNPECDSIVILKTLMAILGTDEEINCLCLDPKVLPMVQEPREQGAPDAKQGQSRL